VLLVNNYGTPEELCNRHAGHDACVVETKERFATGLADCWWL